jgi:hypothetical protein
MRHVDDCSVVDGEHRHTSHEPNVDCDEPRLTGGASFSNHEVPPVRARSRIWLKQLSIAASDVVDNAGCSSEQV